MVENPNPQTPDAPKPYYIIVHPRVVELEDPKSEIPGKLNKIRETEDHTVVLFDPREIDPGIPRDREIILGGGLRGVCVKDQYEALLRAGYTVSISEELTLP